MRVLGVDPGLGRCGWAVLERRDGRVAAAGYGTIRTDVGQASGVVLLLAAEHGLEVTAYTPPQVKLAVTGTGSAPKEQVGYMVKALLGLAAVPTPADTADALAVALCHLNHAGPSDGRGGALGAAPAADWLARAAPTSPGLRRGPAGGVRGTPEGCPDASGFSSEGVPR
jgi:crossover junction endodeoxyribonuclease RuvC